jgi:hypothetical protein
LRDNGNYVWVRLKRGVAYLVSLVLNEAARKSHSDAMREKNPADALHLRRQADELDEASEAVEKAVRQHKED